MTKHASFSNKNFQVLNTPAFHDINQGFKWQFKAALVTYLFSHFLQCNTNTKKPAKAGFC